MLIDRDELRVVLQNRLDRLQKKNPAFSLRAYAKMLNIGAAEVSEVLRNKRPISAKRAQSIVERMTLTVEEQERVLRRPNGILAGQSRLTLQELSKAQYEAVSEWHHFAILSLAETVDFQSNPVWIGERLNISTAKAEQALKTLSGLGMITCSDDGVYAATGNSYASSDGVPFAALRMAQHNNLELAKISLERDSIAIRDFRALTVAVDPVHIPEVKLLITEFRDRLATFVSKGQKKEVYKFCMQFFPLTATKPNVKEVVLFLFLCASCFVSMPLFATAGGHTENNGGGVMACPDAGVPGGIRYTMLDLWEAAKITGHTIEYRYGPDSQKDLEAEVERVVRRNKNISFAVRDTILHSAEIIIEELFRKDDLLPEDVVIAPPLDGGNGFMGRGCVLRGVALYDNLRRRVYVDADIFAHMSLTDKAGLVIHEAVYKVFRAWYAAENSIGARRFVGCLFAKDGCEDFNLLAQSKLDPNRTWHCMSSRALDDSRFSTMEFYISLPQHTWYFTRMYQRELVTRTIADQLYLGMSLSKETPIVIRGESYFPLLGNASWVRPVLAASPSGQSLRLTLGTQRTDAGMQFHVNGEPIVCNYELPPL